MPDEAEVKVLAEKMDVFYWKLPNADMPPILEDFEALARVALEWVGKYERFPKQRTGGVDFRTFTEMAFDEGAPMITDEQLKEWRALADAAASPPVKIEPIYEEHPPHIRKGFRLNFADGSRIDTTIAYEPNAIYLAEVWNSFPALIDEVERLRARLENADREANNERNPNA